MAPLIFLWIEVSNWTAGILTSLLGILLLPFKIVGEVLKVLI